MACPKQWLRRAALLQQAHWAERWRGVILWGLCVLVPPAFCDRLLEELHKSPCPRRTKALARSYVWWPNINRHWREGKDLPRMCNTLPMAPLQPWSWPTWPWQRVHIDCAEYQEKYFFVAIDAHSKWPEVFATTKPTTDDHQLSASSFLFLWLSRKNGEWQQSSVHIGPVCGLPETEWSQTHQVCPIPSCNQRSCWKNGLSSEERCQVCFTT